MVSGMSTIEIQTIVDNFVTWYNKIRPHSSLSNLTPYQRFYRNRMTKIASLCVRYVYKVQPNGIGFYNFFKKDLTRYL